MACADGRPNYIDHLPDHVLKMVMETLDFKDRCAASSVCKRWYFFLTEILPVDDVSVFNIFQKSIWQTRISDNPNVRLKCFKLAEPDDLCGVVKHFRFARSVKIWFSDSYFALNAIRLMKEGGLDMRCLDIYPYGKMNVLHTVRKYYPDLKGLTTRPHGEEFFYRGLELDEFPDFPCMDTLLLDSYNLTDRVILPASLTTFEWLNRNPEEFFLMLPRLKALVSLEYLMVAHAEFSMSAHLSSFLETVSDTNTPRLQYLIFRFCKFDKICDICDESTTEAKLSRLSIVKFDLCYGDIPNILRYVLHVTGKSLHTVSLNMILDHQGLTNMYSISGKLKSRNILMHLSLMQKDRDRPFSSRSAEDNLPLLSPPSSFAVTLTKFEASFTTDERFLRILLTSSVFQKLIEAKFIQCDLVGNDVLPHLARHCPRLRKLYLIHCKTSNDGDAVAGFVEGLSRRISKSLQIVWKCHRPNSSNRLRELIIDGQSTVIRSSLLTVGYTRKKFLDERDGERVTLLDSKSGRVLHVQNYDGNDLVRIVGVVVPEKEQPNLSDSIADEIESLRRSLNYTQLAHTWE